MSQCYQSGSWGTPSLVAVLPVFLILRLCPTRATRRGRILPGWLCRLLGRGVGAACRGQSDLGSLTQTVGTIDNDAFARFEPGQDCNVLSVGGPDLHFFHRHGLIRLYCIDKGTRRTTLYRRIGHQHYILQGIYEEFGVYKLVWK